MAQESLKITKCSDDGERFSRFKLIEWWNQEILKAARIMVIGAGALGNEIIKNLSLLGIGNIFIADMDRIESSNLSRSILYRESDNGRGKAEVAAGAAKGIFPGVKIKSFSGNIVYDLGMGLYRWADVVMAGLDNREARLSINRSCWKTTTPWIDGAIEAINGVARVFVPPDGSCYECTMNETDWKELQSRRSCNLLTQSEMELGKVPTTPTISSIVAGVQCQELLKILHAIPSLNGEGFLFNGMTTDSYLVKYPRKEECLSHETWEEIIETGWSAKTATLGQALEFIKKELGADALLELNSDVLTGFGCPGCNARERIFRSLGKVTYLESKCPECGDYRIPEFTHTITGCEAYLDLTLHETGVPPFDIISGRSGMEEIHLELSGDREETIGEL